MTRESKPIFRLVIVAAVPALLALAARPAQADFFDGARQTFQTDIPHFFTQDVPHFFQDDIPCAFGGRPTSGARQSCSAPPEHAKSVAPPAEPPPVTTEPVAPPVNSGQ